MYPSSKTYRISGFSSRNSQVNDITLFEALNLLVKSLNLPAESMVMEANRPVAFVDKTAKTIIVFGSTTDLERAQIEWDRDLLTDKLR